MSELTINPEFQNLLPKLTGEEYAQLKESILSEGCRDPIIVWNNTIVDGHNRFRICREFNVPFDTKKMDFESDAHARIWICCNQGGRRNVSDGWRVEMKLAIKAALEEIGKKKMSDGGKGLSTNDKPFEPHNTQKILAESLNMSTGKLAQAMVVKERDPKLWEKVKAEETTIHAAYTEIKDREDLKSILRGEMPHVSFNSGDNEWYTPEPIIVAATLVMGGIDLDPASTEKANTIVKAKRFYTALDDGLKKTWEGNVWLNPPYESPLIGRFVDKLIEENNHGAVVQAIALVNNATETKWFGRLAAIANAFCFPTGRVTFWHPEKESAPLQGQAIVYIGKNESCFFSEFRQFGILAKVVK